MNKNHKLLIVLFTFVLFLFSACASKQKTQNDLTRPKPAKIEETKMAEPIAPKENPLIAELNMLQGENGKVARARLRAIEFGADENYPDLFSIPEDLKQKADDEFAGGNLKDAISKYNEAIARYDTLSNLMDAVSYRREIESNGFARYSANNYSEAERLSINTIDHYGLDYIMAKEASEDALNLYKKVVNVGYLELTKTASAVARESKSDCDSIKVARSRTEEYNNAVRSFNRGKAFVEKMDYKKSYMAYSESAVLFAKLYEEVSLKRLEAENAMAEAAKKQQESSDLALEADQEAPLAEAGEWFTDRELVLEDRTTLNDGTPIEDIDEDSEISIDSSYEQNGNEGSANDDDAVRPPNNNVRGGI